MIRTENLQGHWRRNWIRAPGLEDATTRVHWLQAGPWCADIRVPLHRPGVAEAGCLADMATADLAVLLSAEGFAGRIALDGDICTWHRDWNWRGFPCPVDAGKLWFDETGRLIEDGVHADYREEWQQVPGEPWQAQAIAGEAATGVLFRNAQNFLLALGRPGAPARPDLAGALSDGTAQAADAAPVFASVYILGHWHGGNGVADLSTQPFCEGRPVLHLDGPRADLVLPDFHGRPKRLPLDLDPLPAP